MTIIILQNNEFMEFLFYFCEKILPNSKKSRSFVVHYN